MLINIPKDLGRPQPVPAGIYKVLVTGYRVDKSKNSDNMIIKPEFTIQTQTSADGEKVLGRKLWDNWTISEKSLGIWDAGFKALTGRGLADLFGGQNIEQDEFINRITSDINSKECLVQVEVEESDQGARNRIKRYTAIGG